MTDEAQTYNGWANRETWLVALWINNDEGWQGSVLDSLRGATFGTLAETFPGGEMAGDAPGFSEQDELKYRARQAGEIISASVDEHIAYSLTGDPDGSFPAGIGTDLITGALDRVDWSEVGASFLDGLDES